MMKTQIIKQAQSSTILSTRKNCRQYIQAGDNRSYFTKQQALKKAIQRKQVEPEYTGTSKALEVKLELQPNDTVKPGCSTRSSTKPDGYAGVNALGLTSPSNTAKKQWIKFHLLNADHGGRGDLCGHLTMTTQKANHNPTWNDLERCVSYIPTHLISAKKYSIKYEAKAEYPTSEERTWINKDGDKTIRTNDSNYPNKITGHYKDDDPDEPTDYTSTLSLTEGVYGPESIASEITEWTLQ
jgi:hypothetical protein